MFSHDQFAKALARQNITATDSQINNLMNDLLPNPQAGYSCAGVVVWGDTESIRAVKGWHHDSRAVVPALCQRLKEVNRNAAHVG